MKKDRGYAGLWLLLAVSFAAIIAYSCIDTVKVGNTEIKSSGIAERLTDTVSIHVQESKMDEKVREVPRDLSIEPVVTDSASQTILFIGDSTLDNLNPAVAAYAHSNGHKLYSVIWYSSTTEIWGRSDTLGVYLNRFKPTYIIISLGANELFVNDIEAKRDKWVKRLLSQIGDIPYLWIGPPNWKKDTGINDMIAKNVKPGAMFVSRSLVLEREKDGAHPTQDASRQWFDSVAQWMPNHSCHPIKLNKPGDDFHSRPDRVVVLQPLR